MILDVAETSDLTKMGTMSKIDTAGLTELLRRLPEWIRADLSAKDANLRTRAEEALAAMIASELQDGEANEISSVP